MKPVLYLKEIWNVKKPCRFYEMETEGVNRKTAEVLSKSGLKFNSVCKNCIDSNLKKATASKRT